MSFSTPSYYTDFFPQFTQLLKSRSRSSRQLRGTDYEATKEILKYLELWTPLPTVLCSLTFEFAKKEISWKKTKIQQTFLRNYSWGLATDIHSLYVAGSNSNCIYRYSVKPLKLIETWTSPLLTLDQPLGLDLVEHELWITDKSNVLVFDLWSKTVLRHWSLPSASYGIKVNGTEVFVSAYSRHQINIYHRYSGALRRTFGKKGSDPGEFFNPFGLTLDEEYIYICDNGNYRVQALYRESGLFSHQWGNNGSGNTQFFGLCSIYLSVMEDLLYVGDYSGVKVFTKKGDFRNRFGTTTFGDGEGQFNGVYGISIVNNQLYVSDNDNRRIQVWS